MAGMRLGYAVGAVNVINKIRDHVAYEVMMNQTTLAAALSELNDKEFLKESKESNDEAREILYKALKELNIPYLPSQTNFVFIDLKAPLKPFADRMKTEHILVGRPFPPASGAVFLWAHPLKCAISLKNSKNSARKAGFNRLT